MRAKLAPRPSARGAPLGAVVEGQERQAVGVLMGVLPEVPGEEPDGHRSEGEAHENKENQDIHRGLRRERRALVTDRVSSELSGIKTAAIQGCMSPAHARETAATL